MDEKKAPTQKPWFLKSEMIIALSALLISVVTTVTSIYSASIDRAYAKASVWPRLELSRTYKEDIFGYILSNNGTGPALIKYAIVQFQGKTIETWDEIPFIEDVDSFTQSHMGKRVVPSNHTFKPMLIKTTNVKQHINNDRSVKITLCYCSIYDDCWIIDRENAPQKIDHCEIPLETDIFRQ